MSGPLVPTLRAVTEDLDPIGKLDAKEYEMQRDGSAVFVKDKAVGCDFRVQNGVRTMVKEEDVHVLYLGPNEVFFNKTGNLRCVRSAGSEDALNQKKLFSHVTGIHVKNQHVFWGFFVQDDGTASAETKETTGPADRSKRVSVGGALLFDRSKTAEAGAGSKADVPGTHTVRFDLCLTPERQAKKKRRGSKTRTVVIRVDGFDAPALHLVVTPSDTLYAANFEVKGLVPGYHTLEICLQEDYLYKSGFGKIRYLRAWSEDGLLSAVRERWRPFACHISFGSSRVKNASTVIMGMCQLLPSLRSYNPIVARYGYDGFCFNGEGGVSPDNGMNQSVWSFGRKGTRPPMYKMSHGLFVNSARAEFGGFSHEGTGFKWRNFGPQFRGNVSGEHVIVRRFFPEPGYVYGDGRIYRCDTWYWDEEGDRQDLPEEDRGRFRRYGTIRFFTTRKMTTVLTRAFIEVPGVAEVQRTGHVPRGVSYRGYVQDAETKSWHLLDRMQNYPGQHTNKVWSTNDEGTRFVASAGGLSYRTLPGPKMLEISEEGFYEEGDDDEDPDPDQDGPVSHDAVGGFGLNIDGDESMLDEQDSRQTPRYMQFVDQLDVPIPWPTVQSHARKGTNEVSVTINIPDKRSSKNRVTICYGHKDCLTFETEWDKKATKVVESNGPLTVDLPNASSGRGSAMYLRILVQDEDLQVWSKDTYRVKL